MITPTYLLLAASFLAQTFVLAVPIPNHGEGAEVPPHTHHMHTGLGNVHGHHHEINTMSEGADTTLPSHLQTQQLAPRDLSHQPYAHGHSPHPHGGRHDMTQEGAVPPHLQTALHTENTTPEQLASRDLSQRLYARGHWWHGHHDNAQGESAVAPQTAQHTENTTPEQLASRDLSHWLYARAMPAPHVSRPLPRRQNAITPEQIRQLGLN